MRCINQPSEIIFLKVSSNQNGRNGEGHVIVGCQLHYMGPKKRSTQVPYFRRARRALRSRSAMQMLFFPTAFRPITHRRHKRLSLPHKCTPRTKTQIRGRARQQLAMAQHLPAQPAYCSGLRYSSPVTCLRPRRQSHPRTTIMKKRLWRRIATGKGCSEVDGKGRTQFELACAVPEAALSLASVPISHLYPRCSSSIVFAPSFVTLTFPLPPTPRAPLTPFSTLSPPHSGYPGIPRPKSTEEAARRRHPPPSVMPPIRHSGSSMVPPPLMAQQGFWQRYTPGASSGHLSILREETQVCACAMRWAASYSPSSPAAPCPTLTEVGQDNDEEETSFG
jgi:hypothetical protein